MFGLMTPTGGGDPIPLNKKILLIGRRESCDIVLRFANVSAHHCRLFINSGYWYVQDLESRNGIKINGVPISAGRIDSGDLFSVARHQYKFEYSPIELGAVGPPPLEDLPSDLFDRSLLERAGLENTMKKKRAAANQDLMDVHFENSDSDDLTVEITSDEPEKKTEDETP